MPEVEMVIDRSRKFAVLAGSFVSHVRRFPAGPNASICADSSWWLVSSSTIMNASSMRRRWKFMYGKRRSLVSL